MRALGCPSSRFIHLPPPGLTNVAVEGRGATAMTGGVKAAPELGAAPATPPAPLPRARSVLRGALLHGVVHPLVALAAFGAYEHL